MPEFSFEKLRHSPVNRHALEVELDRKLNDPRIKRIGDLPEGSVGDRLVFSREEVRVIENIEELSTEFDVRAFRNSRPLDHAEIEIPEPRSTHRSEMQSTYSTGRRMTKERRICTTVGTNQFWIDHERATRYGIEENAHALLQLVERQRGSGGILAGTSIPVECSAS